jgi:cyanophycinase
VTGPIALHGGGEFLPGDERFLSALLEAAGAPGDARAATSGRGVTDEPIRVVVVPTAAAGVDPDGAARLGTSAFERLASRLDRRLRVEVARVVDAASAEDPELAARIASADLVYFPGGDPAVIPAILPESAAWRAVLAARERGAILAGASAGAMALGPLTWTPDGIVRGLSVVRGLVVFPHADAAMWQRQTARFPAAAATGLGILGLGERTGVISANGASEGSGGPWLVVGEGEVRWLAPGNVEPAILVDGQSLELPA